MTISLSPPDADPVASVETWLVVADQSLNTPLSFAWVWQLVGEPLTSTNRAVVKATVETNGRLGRAAQALEAADGIPLSLVLGPETFETWAAIAEKDAEAKGFDAVRAAVADETRRQVLATPYVPLDLPSLEAAGLAGDVVHDLRVGTDTVESVLGVLPDPRTVVLDPVDAGALAIADDAFAQRIIVRENAVRPVPHVLTPARPFGVAAGGHVYTVAESNAFVDRLLGGAGSRRAGPTIPRGSLADRARSPIGSTRNRRRDTRQLESRPGAPRARHRRLARQPVHQRHDARRLLRGGTGRRERRRLADRHDARADSPEPTDGHRSAARRRERVARLLPLVGGKRRSTREGGRARDSDRVVVGPRPEDRGP